MTSEQPQPSPLDINYRMSEGDFLDVVSRIESFNKATIDREFAQEISWITDGLNLVYRIISYYVWLLNAPHIASLNHASGVLFSACHKNLVALHSSLALVRVGLFGPARTILRHVLEALIIAKFSSVSSDRVVMDRWMEGENIYFANSILKKIITPDIAPFRDFWGLLSEYSHATVFSQQISLNVENTDDEVPLTLVYMRILLDWQYHALVSHLITPSMHYVAKRYARAGTEVPPLKRRMVELLTASRANLLPWPKTIIRTYRATWKIRPVSENA